MAMKREQKYRQMAARGKYQRLYTHLCGLTTQELRTSFSEIEAIIGFELPPSARLHRPWWANQTGGNGHSQALAWTARRMGDGGGGHGRRNAAVPTQANRGHPPTKS